MIRHSSSFLFSILIHIVLFFSLVFLYNNYVKKKELKSSEKRVCVKLCNMRCEKKEEPTKEKRLVKPNIQKKKIIEKKIVTIKQIESKKEKSKVVSKEIITNKKEITTIKVKQTKVKVKEEPKTANVEPEVISPNKNLEPHPKNFSQIYVEDNILEIVKLLQENLYYPRRARKKGITGEVLVEFTLGLDSEVSDINVIKSTKDILSRAAIKTIQNLSGEFPKPKEKLSISVPISYKLN